MNVARVVVGDGDAAQAAGLGLGDQILGRVRGVGGVKMSGSGDRSGSA